VKRNRYGREKSMIRRRSRAAVVIAVTTAVVTAVAPAVGSAAAVTGGRAAAAAPQADPVAGPASRTLTLVTGEQVRVDMAGERATVYRVLPGKRSGALLALGAGGGDRYAVPTDAMPHVGRQLDLSLFDLTALARRSASDGGRTPVTLSFAPGTTPSAPPGVTLTSVDGANASGYLTPESSPAFAMAVHGRSLPGTLRAMRLAGTASPQDEARPEYALHTLRINATDLAGAPAGLGSFVLNTDSFSRFNATVPVDDGEGRVQVPAGHYVIYTTFRDPAAKGGSAAIREVSQDVTVTDDAVTTVAARETDADQRVTVTTPEPSTVDVFNTSWFRKDSVGGVWDYGILLLDPANVALYVNSRPAAPGGSRYVVQWGGAAPDGGAYRYDLAFASDDVPANESFQAQPGQLATVEQHFSADPAAGDASDSLEAGPVDDYTRAMEADGIMSLWTVDSGRTPMPGTRIMHMGTADGGQWRFSVSSQDGGLGSLSDIETLAPGSTRLDNWAHGPLVPNYGTHHDQQFYSCFACAGGGQLHVSFPSPGDSEPGHTGFGLLASNLALYENGKKIFDQPNTPGVRVSTSGTATYRAVYDTDRAGTFGVSQSTRSHTDLTFRYKSTTDPGSALPPGVAPGGLTCEGAACQIMPALTLNYRLDTDAYNTSALTDQTMDFTVGHLSYDGHGSHAAITSAAVSVSFDGGTTWQAAGLTGSGGTYHATWKNTGTAAPVLKVTAEDAAGGSITQTVTDAYSLATGSAR
jgi:hypothetical protein